MQSIRSLLVGLLLPLYLAGCSSNEPRFVKPVAAPVDAGQAEIAASKYQDGYLRIFVSSNLDSTGKIMDFGREEDQRPAKLLISAKFGRGTVASFAADAAPEIPVLLYDVETGKTQSAVVNNALLTEGMLIDPESLSRSPHLQIFVRGVPADKATWVTDLLELATAEPVLKVGLNFVPGGAAFSPLSTKLGDMLSEEIKSTNKPWEEKTLLGLRADEGLASLNGRQFVVLLNPSTIELEAPPKLFRCDARGSITGLCQAEGQEQGKPWVPTQAYVRFELNVTDYRSIKDFIGQAISCEADERVWSDFRVLLASGQLARQQVENERQLLARGELLMQIRRSQAEYAGLRYTGRLLQHAQQYTLLPRRNDAYWREHFQARAQGLDACIRATAVRGSSQYAAIWDGATAAFARAPAYPAWANAIAASDDPAGPALAEAERELVAIRRLLVVGDLAKLDKLSLEGLTTLVNQLEHMLAPGYARIARAIEAGTPAPAEQLPQVAALAERTACQRCAEALQQRAEALRAGIEATAAAEAAAAAAAKAAAAAAAQSAPVEFAAAESAAERKPAPSGSAAAAPTAPRPAKAMPAAAPAVERKPAPSEAGASANTAPQRVAAESVAPAATAAAKRKPAPSRSAAPEPAAPTPSVAGKHEPAPSKPAAAAESIAAPAAAGREPAAPASAPAPDASTAAATQKATSAAPATAETAGAPAVPVAAPAQPSATAPVQPRPAAAAPTPKAAVPVAERKVSASPQTPSMAAAPEQAPSTMARSAEAAPLAAIAASEPPPASMPAPAE